jgi:hypothetical protein
MTVPILFRRSQTFVRPSCFDADDTVLREDPGKISLAPHPEARLGRAAVPEALPGRAGTRLAAVDQARFHDERDPLEHADVFQWIAGHGDDVGVVARLQDADLVLPIEQAGSI